MLKGVKWIGSRIPTNEHSLYRFRRTITLDDVSGITAAICADSRYKLYINGRYVCEGPCIGTIDYYDELELGKYLTVGENLIEAQVLYLGGSKGASCINRKKRAAFCFRAVQNGETLVETDGGWEAAIDNSHSFYLDRYMHSNGYLNEKYAEKPLEWERAVVLDYGFGSELWGVLPYFDVRCRPIRMYTPMAPFSMEVSKSEGFSGLKLVAGQSGYVIFELGRHMVGYPEFEFSGKADVTVTYAESYVFPRADGGRYDKHRRDDSSGNILGASDELELREISFVFRPFMTKTARYIKVSVKALEDFEIKRAEFMEYHYPFDIKNDFTCSDEVYNRIFRTSINTLENCTFDTYVDCPYYEMQQYSEDAYLEMMYTFMLTDNSEMPKKLILDLWQSQNYEGIQLAAAPMFAKQITPTFNFFWIMMLDKYLLYTDDTETIEPMLAGVYSILSWFAGFIDEDGVLGVYRYGKFIDWVKGWKSGFSVDGADTEATAVSSFMFMYTLKLGAKLFERFGRLGVACDLTAQYNRLKEAVNRVFYDDAEKLYRDTKDGDFCEHNQIWAVLSGAISGDAAKSVLLGCEREDVRKCSYSYRFFKNRAYEECGMELDMDSFLADWKTMLELGATTWFENPGNARSDCHAWSSVPIYEFTTKILGVRLEEGFNGVIIDPKPGKLTSASGTVPTKYGEIHVSWKKNGEIFKLAVSSPEGIAKQIGFNGSERFNCTDTLFGYEFQ